MCRVIKRISKEDPPRSSMSSPSNARAKGMEENEHARRSDGSMGIKRSSSQAPAGLSRREGGARTELRMPASPTSLEKYRRATRHVELRQLLRGDFFGEWSMIHKKRRSATVVASYESELLVLSRSSFLKLVEGGLSERLKELCDDMEYLFDDDDIREDLRRNMMWEDYRSKAVHDCVYHLQK
uniref:Cyclic nucleotide-binding domain-containing protein n=2 Tax=Guillardia theta TaxID=55529 RepID=A0A7S4KPK9_GUITH|mmetsp:Transcript_28560/g.92158  ORF Transcript_28560/g.92158 Transcript_28560/m.92158 type:complete len:183 (+) Transcript_28560:816-1364(+)